MKDFLASSYDRYAHKYDDTFRDLQYEKFRKLLIPIKARISGNRIVDAGCGTGLLSDFLKEENIPADIVGIDISFKMLELAAGKKNQISVQGDMYMIPVRTASSDIVCSFTVMNIFPDQEEEIISEFVRIVKPGGLVIISVLKKVFNNKLIQTAQKHSLKLVLKEEAGQDIGMILTKTCTGSSHVEPCYNQPIDY